MLRKDKKRAVSSCWKERRDSPQLLTATVSSLLAIGIARTGLGIPLTSVFQTLDFELDPTGWAGNKKDKFGEHRFDFESSNLSPPSL